MKIVYIFVFITLCSQMVWGNSDPKQIASTTPRPWTQKFKDGLSYFFRGASAISAVQHAIQNGRSGGTHKNFPSTRPKY